MMDIIEDISENGVMNDNQYLTMMNLLLKIHKSEEQCQESDRDISRMSYRELRGHRALQSRRISEHRVRYDITYEPIEYSLRSALEYSYSMDNGDLDVVIGGQ